MKELKNAVRTYDESNITINTYNTLIGVNLIIGVIITAIATMAFKNNLGLLFYAHPIIFSILFLVVTIFAEVRAIASDSTPIIFGWYSVICIAVGALFSSVVPYYDINTILFAAGSTFLILIIMVIAARIVPNAFLSLGKGLFIALVSFIIAEIIMLLIFGTSFAFMDYIAIFIFSLYIGYDWSRGTIYPKNKKFAILTALMIYMDIINIFIRLLSRSSSSKK